MSDEKGNVRVQMNMDEDGQCLIMRDENNNIRVGMGVNKDGPTLIMTDENGKQRTGMIVAKDEAGLIVKDENGKQRINLTVDKVPRVANSTRSAFVTDGSAMSRAVASMVATGSTTIGDHGRVTGTDPRFI